MGGVGDEIVVPRMGDVDLHRRARPADPVQLLDDAEKDLGIMAEMLEAVIEQHLLGLAGWQRPGELFEIDPQIGAAFGLLVDVHIAVDPLEPAAHIIFHRHP